MTTEDHRHPHEGADGGEDPAGIWTAEHLAEHLREYLSARTAIVCVGNELCGDDAAGVAVARKLSPSDPSAPTLPEGWTVYETQTVPESFLMKIVKGEPETVILIDALHFGAGTGAIELIEPGDITGQGPSTHGPAPLAFLDVLNMFHPTRRVVLGIQPEKTEFGAEMSAEVCDAVDRIVAAFGILAANPQQ